MKRGQKGFGAVEGLLILILVSILGFTGYYVYHTSKNATSNYSNAAKSSDGASAPASSNEKVYQGDGFTLKYPTDWKLTKGTDESPDDRFTLASSPSTTSDPTIYIESGATTYSKASEDWPVNGSGRAGSVIDSKNLTINGYSAYYVVTTFDNTKLYTYDIVQNGKSVNINLQKVDSDTASLPVLEKVANSIHF